jgi:hypothetical protein
VAVSASIQSRIAVPGAGATLMARGREPPAGSRNIRDAASSTLIGRIGR